MSFAKPGLQPPKYLMAHHAELGNGVFDVPEDIDRKSRGSSSKAMGIVTRPAHTPKQAAYLGSWQHELIVWPAHAGRLSRRAPVAEPAAEHVCRRSPG